MSKKNQYLSLIFFSILLSFPIKVLSSINDNIESLNTLSFNSIEYDEKFLDEELYSEFLREYIFSQPEFAYATAIQNEKSLLLRGARRERFPTLSGRVVNDEILDRKIDDYSSLRKRQDDSFDVVAEINQPLYLGGRINSQIRFAEHEAKGANIDKKLTTSRLVLEANETFLYAMIYYHLHKYSLELLEGLEPYREKMGSRVQSGAIDPVEHAVFLARLNKFQSTIFTLEARSKTSIANFENTFRISFEFLGFPKIGISMDSEISKNDSFALLFKESQYFASLENVNVTKSDYMPKLGVQARYTKYDIDQSSNESDIRGGIYLSFPIFDFGRGRAKINASKARARSAQVEIDIEKKNNDVKENELITIIESSYKANEKLKDVFQDTKKQRTIIRDRILLSGFSPITLIEASENELVQLQILLESEYKLLASYYSLLHQNRFLLNQLKLKI